MPRLHLTDVVVQRLKTVGIYYDETTPAFGIRIGKNRKAWVCATVDAGAHPSPTENIPLTCTGASCGTQIIFSEMLARALNPGVQEALHIVALYIGIRARPRGRSGRIYAPCYAPSYAPCYRKGGRKRGWQAEFS
jgi:hypothetical protein